MKRSTWQPRTLKSENRFRVKEILNHCWTPKKPRDCSECTLELSHESTARVNSRRPGWKTLAFSCLHVGSLARQTRQLTIGRVRNKNYRDRNESPIYSDVVRRHRLSKGDTLFRRTRYQHGSVEREERKK